ncbi:hypothetical protein [Nocardia sp. NPDC050793]|uniref:hypothetical protein n=1 Tax=Nocardia sp. NPDC050793 TaxID=3155159 RepID=UPI003401745C
MTDPAIPTTAALDAIFVIANAVTGDQFVIYGLGPHDERGMYHVAHVSGGTGATPPRASTSYTPTTSPPTPPGPPTGCAGARTGTPRPCGSTAPPAPFTSA